MSGNVVFDVAKADPIALSKLSMEELADDTVIPGEKTEGEDPPEGSTSASPDATTNGDKPAGDPPKEEPPKQEPPAETDAEKNFRALRTKLNHTAQELDEANRREAELRRQLEEATGQTAPTLEELDNRIKAFRDKAEQVREDAPGIAADYEEAAKDLERVRNAEAKAIKDREEQAERNKRDAEARQRADEQKVIEGIPMLHFWQENDLDTFDLVVDQYELLRKNPEFTGDTMGQLLSRATEAVRILKPSAKLPEAPPPQVNDKKETPPAAPKKAEPETPAAPIRSLSDVPGGLTPPANVSERVAQTSAANLGLEFSKMTRAQQDAWLAAE